MAQRRNHKENLSTILNKWQNISDEYLWIVYISVFIEKHIAFNVYIKKEEMLRINYLT